MVVVGVGSSSEAITTVEIGIMMTNAHGLMRIVESSADRTPKVGVASPTDRRR